MLPPCRNNGLGHLFFGQIEGHRIGRHITDGLAGGASGQQGTGQYQGYFINEFHNISFGEDIHQFGRGNETTQIVYFQSPRQWIICASYYF